jgi:deoxycytidine triphosphate deaminase
MIWNDRKIYEWASTGGVTPYANDLVNPASLDLRLGNMIRRPDPIWDRLSTVDIDQKIADGSIRDLPKWGEPIEFSSTWLKRGEFVLLHSLEFVCIPPHAASILVLKSSRGRDGMNHSHSGWGDPGFGYPKVRLTVTEQPTISGAQWTFEIYNLAKWPIELKAGAPVIQMIMMDMCEAPQVDYRHTGHYVYQSGPTIAHSG